MSGRVLAGRACADVDPEVFFGAQDSAAGEALSPWERRALQVCARCPVVEPCRDEALRFPGTEQHGVIGGMTAAARRTVLSAAVLRARRSAERVQRGREVVCEDGVSVGSVSERGLVVPALSAGGAR